MSQKTFYQRFVLWAFLFYLVVQLHFTIGDYIPVNSIFGTYGNNRLLLEKWCMENVPDYMIVRLPGIYGMGIKKNLIYDIMHIVPQMLTENTYRILNEWKNISKYYKKCNNQWFVFRDDMYNEDVKRVFLDAPINALSYVNIDSIYQYYNLRWLLEDICLGIENKISILNIATEPVSSREILSLFNLQSAYKDSNVKKIEYNMQTKNSWIKDREGCYLYDKDIVLRDIENFCKNYEQKQLRKLQ